MKNLFTLFIVLVFTNFICKAQINLVPNPSFEDTIDCPQLVGDFKPADWYVVEQTPDYLNACCSNITQCSVPQNFFSNRNAATGVAYCGLISYFNLSLYREKIGVKLNDTLKAGKRYIVSFKISSVSSVNALGNCATNRMGFLFSTHKYDLMHLSPTNNFCQFKTDSLITDTLGWKLVKGNFIADSLFCYLSIGTFYDNQNVDTLRYFYENSNPNVLQSYNFIDDIYVGYDSSQDVGILNTLLNDFSVYPNPTTGVVNISTGNLQIEKIEIFNTVGCKEKEVFHPPVQAVLRLDIADLISGIYLLKIKTNNTTTLKKLNIIH
jgi:hypothetical protein